MSTASGQYSPIRASWATFFHISRFHIITIAAMAALTFGWVFSGRFSLLIPLLVGFDWFLVNLLNRVVDLAEDQLNGVVGTGFVDRNAKALTVLCWVLMAGSIPLVHLVAPDLTGYRVIFHLIGIAYNYRIIPGLKGLTRFKEMYFFKNFMSGVLFLLSGIFYPAVALGVLEALPVAKLILFCAFFLCMDLTYEIFYDLRDLPGDRAVGVPTFPVIHGELGARRIVVALIVAASAFLVYGYAAGHLAFHEVIMIAAPIQQAIFYRLKVPQGLTQRDCVFVTYLGAAQLLSYNLWNLAGLPLELPV